MTTKIGQAQSRQRHRIVFAANLVILILALGLAGCHRAPAGTFPDKVGPYTLGMALTHGSNTHAATDATNKPKDSWWSVYRRSTDHEVLKGVRQTIDVQLDVLMYLSAAQAKKALETFAAGLNRESIYYSAKVSQQGTKPDKPDESFQLIEYYFNDKDKPAQLASNQVVWTSGTKLLIAKSTPPDSPAFAAAVQKLGVKEAASDFMRDYPE